MSGGLRIRRPRGRGYKGYGKYAMGAYAKRGGRYSARTAGFKRRVYAIAKTAVRAGRERKSSELGSDLNEFTMDTDATTGIFESGVDHWLANGVPVPEANLGRNDSTVGANGALVAHAVWLRQGTDQYERIGNAINASSLQVTGDVHLSGGATQGIIRVSVFQDCEPPDSGTAAPDVSAFYQEDAFGEITSTSLRRLAGRMRFRCVGEQTMNLSATGEQAAPFNIYCPLGDVPCIFNTPVVAHSTDANCYWIVITSNRNGDSFLIKMTARFRFTDA